VLGNALASFAFWRKPIPLVNATSFLFLVEKAFPFVYILYRTKLYLSMVSPGGTP